MSKTETTYPPLTAADTPDPARDAITTRGAQTVRDALERTR